MGVKISYWTKGRKIALGFAGVSLLILVVGLICAFFMFPWILDLKKENYLNMWNDDSPGNANFLSAPFNVYRKFYFFGLISNDFESGEKPFIVEHGPYTYRVRRLKAYIQKEPDHNRIRYEQLEHVEFRPDLSCEYCNNSDSVLTVNLPKLMLIHYFKYQVGGAEGDFFLAELDKHTSPPSRYIDDILTHKEVQKLLYLGHETGSLKWIQAEYPDEAAKLSPNVIKNDDLYVYFNVNNEMTESLGRFEVMIPNWDHEDYYKTTHFSTTYMNHSHVYPDLNEERWWTRNGGYEESNYCNELRGTDGLQFKVDVKETDRLEYFHPHFCRSVSLEFKEWVEYGGMSLLRFTESLHSLKMNTKDNLGFCKEHEGNISWSQCIQETVLEETLNIDECTDDPESRNACVDGVFNIDKCKGWSPIALTLPHFLHSPEKLRRECEGLTEPTIEKHEPFYDINPDTGTVVRMAKRYQINARLRQHEEMKDMQSIREVYLPILWLDEEGEMDAEGIDAMKRYVESPKKTLVIVQWTLVGVGAFGFVVSMFFVLFCCK